MAAKRIYGIDLGTTYSCISYIDESGRPVVVPNAEGENTTPSVVYFESADNIVVGKEAKNASKLAPDRVFAFVKRDMGMTATYSVGDETYRPEQISSFILRKLAHDAAQHIGDGTEVTDVVITCPAYFGINEREATRSAGKIAGLNVHYILNEPTAAAICYSAGKSEDKVVLVYDLGGGTFDITVIEMKGGEIRVIYTDGNHNLGGKDWDDVVITNLADQFTREHPDKGSPLDEPESFQQLVIAAEEAKKALSTREKSAVLVSHGGGRTRVELTRDQFETLTAAKLGETIELTRRVLERAAERGFKKIDQLLLVGGSSRMPYVARRLKEEFGLEPTLFEPDLAVAKGAALMGAKLLAGQMIREIVADKLGKDKEEVDLSQLDERTLQDAAVAAQKRSGGVLRLPAPKIVEQVRSRIVNVCSRGFGIVVVTDDEGKTEEVYHLIKSNTPVPLEIRETRFKTLKANQQSVSIRVMEAKATTESPSLDHNNEIGSGAIENLPAGLPAGAPIHVTFNLAEDGTLGVAAVEPSSGRELRLNIKTQSIMNQSEVEESRAALALKRVS